MAVDGGDPSSAPLRQRRQWQRVFGALLEMLRQRQRQVETLAGDREFLLERVDQLRGRWASKSRHLEYQISQMKRQQERGRSLGEAKLGVMFALREMESSLYKELAEDADDDLQAFYECVETLHCENLSLEEKIKEGKNEEIDMGVGGHCDLAAEKDRKEEENISSDVKELRNWKQAYKKLSSRKEAEVSALLAEKDFVWHQFKKMESDYTGLLKSKQVEVEHANEALEKLQANVEKLQSSAADKDVMIDSLEANVSRIELELRNRTREAQMNGEEIKKLHLDMEKLHSLVKEKDDIIAELQSELAKNEVNMRKCSNRKGRTPKELSLLTKSGHRVMPSQRVSVSQSSSVPNDSSGSRTTDMGLRRCSKRKSVVPMSALDSPKLFQSNFKVPKLKNTSPAPT